MNMTGESDPIVVAARREVDRMRAAVAGRDESAPVRMSAGQFTALAALIDRLADRCGMDGSGETCWLDGAVKAEAIRSWVPLPALQAVHREVERREEEVLTLRAQLSAREAENVRLTSLAFGLQPAC